MLERFFTWIDGQFDNQGFLPSSPFLGALADIRERRVGLSVYLDDPEVSVDTNHLEGALRVIPMGTSLVQQLTPRIWKDTFAANPLWSDLHDLGGRHAYTAA